MVRINFYLFRRVNSRPGYFVVLGDVRSATNGVSRGVFGLVTVRVYVVVLTGSWVLHTFVDWFLGSTGNRVRRGGLLVANHRWNVVDVWSYDIDQLLIFDPPLGDSHLKYIYRRQNNELNFLGMKDEVDGWWKWW